MSSESTGRYPWSFILSTIAVVADILGIGGFLLSMPLGLVNEASHIAPAARGMFLALIFYSSLAFSFAVLSHAFYNSSSQPQNWWQNMAYMGLSICLAAACWIPLYYLWLVVTFGPERTEALLFNHNLRPNIAHLAVAGGAIFAGGVAGMLAMLLRQGMYRFDELRGVVLFSGNGAQEVKYQQPFVRAPNLILVRPDGAIYRYQVRDQGPEGFEVEITRTKGEDVLGYRATGAFRRTS